MDAAAGLALLPCSQECDGAGQQTPGMLPGMRNRHVPGSMSMPSVVLGIDIGTSATKVLAFDATGAEHARATVGYELHEPRPGQAVQDPDVILAAVLGAIREAAGHARAAGARIAGLSFSAALHTLIALDGAGRPLTPSITWADTRADEQAQRLRAGDGGLERHRRTGTPQHPMAPLAKLIWFRECDPATFATARRWVGIKEYVVAQMTGEWVIDISIASATGLLDLAALDWDDEALQLAGIDRARLSTVVPSTHVLAGLTPMAARRLDLPTRTPVVVGAGDGPLANLGVGAVRPGVAACSIGTSGALRVTVKRPVVDPDGGVFCYALTAERWTVGGAINNGGVVLEWVRDTFAPDLEEDAETVLLDEAARAPAGCDGLLMLPHLLGERAPQWDSVPRGAYVGLTRAHRREHLVRAAVEGVCLQLALVLQSLRAAGLDVGELRATGGFARSPFWRQLLADVLGIDIGFPAGGEGSSLGAALLGMRALEIIESIDTAAGIVRIDEIRRPDPAAAAVYAARLPVFAAVVPALGPTFLALRSPDATA